MTQPDHGAEDPGTPVVLELRDVDKHFGPVHANRAVSLSLRQGSVHAVLGENGAGKSTLMNILFGVLMPDSGEIRVHGEPRTFATPKDAIAAGIGMVFQHFGLVPELSALDNISLGAERTSWGLVDRDAARAKIEDLCRELRVELPLEQRVSALTVSQQQRVEILKALYRGARILILDEPTALLAPQEREGLFDAVKRLQQTGVSVLFITHKLDEVELLADDVTVIRHGAVVARHRVGTVTQDELVADMVGAATVALSRTERVPLDVAMAVRELTAVKANSSSLRQIDLELRAGEITGVIGIDGHGHQLLCEVLAGVRSPAGGEVSLFGVPQRRWGRARAMAAGVAFVPEDRLTAGVAKHLSIAENLVANRLGDPLITRFTFIRRQASRRHARVLIEQFDVRCRDELQPVGSLSGGNVQKVVLARELSTDPRVVVVCEPTRGLDIAAIASVHGRLAAAADGGAAVVLQSSDLDEVLAVVNRIVVFRDGRIVADVPNRDDVDAKVLGALMLGAARPEAA
ncbi:ABC transporter ATP-binding protein [Kribbella solani]|uniref:ABC transporter ATP-binding protein n=1 Tax=Kribbella solani TaxID=236067 RepID=UPI0029AB4334|nr:ABC transporter ATP-binding protein [Kribbella solani]MDX2969740.1 ABC transporter ATP-binding protein [Kribbella solani]MDX3001709.1 ABC transporter ATP-binding protein [Kribbella solani]